MSSHRDQPIQLLVLCCPPSHARATSLPRRVGCLIEFPAALPTGARQRGTWFEREEDVEGLSGKQDDVSSRRQEARFAVMHTIKGQDPETYAVLKDSGSETCICLIDSAAVLSGRMGASEFVARTSRLLRCTQRSVVLAQA